MILLESVSPIANVTDNPVECPDCGVFNHDIGRTKCWMCEYPFDLPVGTKEDVNMTTTVRGSIVETKDNGHEHRIRLHNVTTDEVVEYTHFTLDASDEDVHKMIASNLAEIAELGWDAFVTDWLGEDDMEDDIDYDNALGAECCAECDGYFDPNMMDDGNFMCLSCRALALAEGRIRCADCDEPIGSCYCQQEYVEIVPANDAVEATYLEEGIASMTPIIVEYYTEPTLYSDGYWQTYFFYYDLIAATNALNNLLSMGYYARFGEG